jgi:transposase
MDVVYERCCGLDIHKQTVVACAILPGPHGQPQKEVRTFGTLTDELQQLAAWLAERQVRRVAMESTGVYWKPIWNLLEEQGFELVLANARHVKQVPGRKTDVKDAEWLADLLRHGLIRGSYVPDRAQRELRELTRYRTSLVQERAAEANRLAKTLEGANLKLTSVASNVVGASSRAILHELVAGRSDPAGLAELAQGRLRAKLPQLERALVGRFGPHQRFLVAQQLAHIEALDESIERVSAELRARLRPFEDLLRRLDTIPGIARPAAEVLLAEVGADQDRFPTAAQLASWAGVCPGHDESAGKRRSGRTRKGSPWLRAVLTQAAHAAAKTKHTYVAAQYHRLAARRGTKRAAVAVAHSLLVIVWHLLGDPRATYLELGPRSFDARDRQAVERRLVRRLEGFGYTVTLQPRAAA